MANPTLSHLRTMLWLRWRLTRNQWRRGGGLNAVIMLVFMWIVLLLTVVGSVGGVVGGYLWLSQASPEVTLMVFDGLIAVFLFMWLMGLMTELQQSQILDLGRFLHLPVALRDVFMLNYLASLFSFSMAMILPLMLGLTVGLLLGRGLAMLLLLPLIIGFFFMITAWTHCLRGWLAALMVNKRRRQAIVMGFMLTFFLLSQVPNLVMNLRMHRRPQPAPQTEKKLLQDAERADREQAQMKTVFKTAHLAVPLLWLPNGAEGLMEGRVWPALWGALGMFGFGCWGFARAYRGTLRFYQGVESGKPIPESAAGKKRDLRAKTLLVERRLPFVPEPASALGMAALRSMSRAPEVKIALAVNFVMFGMAGVAIFLNGRGAPPPEFRPFVACGSAGVTFLGLTQLMFNHFGFDRNGFRAIALLPSPRRHILLGKNIALAGIALVVFSFFLVMVTAAAHLRFLDVLAAGLEFVALFLIMCVLGNLASILVPYRVAPGSMKRTKMSGVTALLIFVSHSISMVAILTVLLPPLLGALIAYFSGISTAIATLACALVLVACASALYWATLGPLGTLLERREAKILEMVTQEVE